MTTNERSPQENYGVNSYLNFLNCTFCSFNFTF